MTTEPLSPAIKTAGVPPWPHDHADIDGTDLHWIDHGPLGEQREPLVLMLIHGAQGNWSHWRANVDELAKSYRVVVPDMPGFGRSGPLENADLSKLASSMSKLIDKLHLRRIALVGYSFGSLVASTLAGTRSDTIEKMLIINPMGWQERSAETIDLQIKASIRGKEAGLRAGIEFTLREIMLGNHQYVTERCIDESEFAVRSFRLNTKEMSRTSNLLELLGAVQVPWHVVFGAEDAYHRNWLEERAAKLAAISASAETTIIQKARHWAQQDQPQVINQLIKQFAKLEGVASTLPLRT